MRKHTCDPKSPTGSYLTTLSHGELNFKMGFVGDSLPQNHNIHKTTELGKRNVGALIDIEAGLPPLSMSRAVVPMSHVNTSCGRSAVPSA